MMRFLKLCAVCMLLAVILSGCRQNNAPEQTDPQVRVVTQVRVTYQSGRTVLQRNYTSDEKIESVLLYLRLLKRKGPARIDPERMDGASCQIVLAYSDGQERNYYQRGEQYLSQDSHPWQVIDPKQGSWLYPLLEQTPSDG